MLGEHCLDAGVVEAVVDRQDMGAGNTKDMIDTQSFHIPDDQLTHFHFHTAVLTQALWGRRCACLAARRRIIGGEGYLMQFRKTLAGCFFGFCL